MHKTRARDYFSLYTSQSLTFVGFYHLSHSNRCANDEVWSLYTSLNALSCKLFILLLSTRLWNFQTREQYENCDSINAFNRSLSLSWSMNNNALASACNFKLTFLHMLDIWSLKVKRLSIFMPRSFNVFHILLIFLQYLLINHPACQKSVVYICLHVKKLLLNHSNKMQESNCRASTSSASIVYGVRSGIVSIICNPVFSYKIKYIIYILNRSSPKMESCGTPTMILMY